MLFHSFSFIFFFLPAAFVVYFGLQRMGLERAAKGWLVLASLFFYSWWNVSYLPLILGSMIVNFQVGSRLARSRSSSGLLSRKQLLAGGVIFNLGLLGYFKYADFFVANVNWGLQANFALPEVVLPLAISFFTFQQIAYLVDSYREDSPEYEWLNYALFVTFFPQLIAGPIVHHKEMMPQFADKSNAIRQYRNIAMGLFIFSIGLFKKIIIADTFGQWATPGFDTAPELTFWAAWGTSLSYTFQLYFDFTAYMDMAIGAALLFNIRLPINFNAPYRALDIQDFWRRWHMTLSRFLRDYLYIPLGGNRQGTARTYLNIFLTFLLGGLWHGAGWMFVTWGALHGAALILHRIWQQVGFRLPALLAWFLTFQFVNFAWIFFRAETMSDAAKVIRGMLGLTGGPLPNAWVATLSEVNPGEAIYIALRFAGGRIEEILLLLCAALLLGWVKNSHVVIQEWRPSIGVLGITLIAFWLSILSLLGDPSQTSEFLYFNF